MTLKNSAIFLIVATFLSLSYGFLRLFYFVRISGRIVEQSRPYEQSPTKPTMKILVMGDSTALGTGASKPANSVAGRLGKDFPNAKIVNRAENGMKTEQLRERFDEFIQKNKYDLIVVHIGANDVLRLKDLNKTKQNIHEIMNRSRDQSRYVALFTSGNIGDAELIPWFARLLMSYRSKELRNFGVAMDSELDNLSYVDLYYKEADISKTRFYAEDMLHLSDDGYGYWHQELKAILTQKTDLY